MSAKPPTPAKPPAKMPKLPKLRLLDVFKRYPAASAAVGGALVLLAGWQMYQGMASRSAPPPPVVAPPARPIPAPGAPAAPTTPGAPGAGATATPGGPGVTAAVPVTPGGPGSITAPSGRPDPFIPLVGPGGGGNPTLTDVPAVPPGMPLPPGVAPAGLAGEAGLRVAGIIWDHGALAILIDEQHSYIVGAGDEITPGLKVLRIDIGRRSVQVQRSGSVEELTLQGRGGLGR
jgi:hypothetical protein